MADHAILVGLGVGLVSLALWGGAPRPPVVVILLALAGAVLGGVLVRAAGSVPDGSVDVMAAALGAVTLVLLYRSMMRRRD